MLRLTMAGVHLGQMLLLLTREKLAWRPQIPLKKLVNYRVKKALKASEHTFTDSVPARIFPHETASSGRAPESEPSNSWPVF
jgi:hypothetical protein